MTFHKNITVIVEYFPPRLGADRRIFEIMRRLSKKYRVNFIAIPPAYTLFLKKIDDKSLPETRLICNNMVGYRIGLPTWVLGLWSRGFFLPYAITVSYLFLRVLRKLIECGPHLVVIKDTSVYAGLIGTLCSRVLGKASIVDFDDLKSSYTAQLARGKVKKGFSLTQKLLTMVEDFILKNNWKVTALSNFLVNYATQRGVRNDLILIPDGVDTSLFDPSKFDRKKVRTRLGIPERTKLCVYTGRIDENMGGEIILETARLLNNETSTIKFLIIGEGDSSLITRLAKLKNTILMGRVPIEEIPEYIAGADIVLVPYPNKPASHAASPLKLFEGLAMEKLVVASAVSGIKEVFNEDLNGILVPPETRCWASVITQLVKNYDKASLLRKNCRRAICEKYDWNLLAEAFDKVIESRFEFRE
jgi:glycosyltransferase involved in cell wall biosynthesis